MTKEELKWIYGGIALTITVFIFRLDFISSASPLTRGDHCVELDNVGNFSEACRSLLFNFDLEE